jgi:hypothetical protein
MENLIIPKKLQSLDSHIFIKTLTEEWLKERGVTLKSNNVNIIFNEDSDIISINSDKVGNYIIKEKVIFNNLKTTKELCVIEL